jgi:hypothetical protein
MADARNTVVQLPSLFTFEEIAERYGYSLRGMKDDARDGKFEYTRRGKTWRMTPAQVEAFIALHACRPSEDTDPLAGVRARHARKRDQSPAASAQRGRRGAA